MKPETEATFNAIVSMDHEIETASACRAISILNGRTNQSKHLVSVLRISEVAKLLGVSMWTIHQYAAQGVLEKVYGGGRYLLGISRSSYVAFSEKSRRAAEDNNPSNKPLVPTSQKRTVERESRVRKIRWAMHLPQNASRGQRLIAIDGYLREHPKVSNRMACEAAGINCFGYSYHKLRSKGGSGVYASQRKAIVDAILRIQPDRRSPACVRNLQKRLTRLGLVCCPSTLYSILDDMGYSRKRYQHHTDARHETASAKTGSAPLLRTDAPKRGPYRVARIRRQKTLELIRKLYPDKEKSVTISHVRQRLISSGTPLTTYMTIRRILLDAGYTIFGQHTSPLRYRRRSGSGKRSMA